MKNNQFDNLEKQTSFMQSLPRGSDIQKCTNSNQDFGSLLTAAKLVSSNTELFNNCLSQESKPDNVELETPLPNKGNRKQKSLSVLCKHFLQRYINYPTEKVIKVDELSFMLGVERRRIYDIMNIFTAIFIVSKKAKNCYVWNGFDNLYFNINKLSDTVSENTTDYLSIARSASVDTHPSCIKQKYASKNNSTLLFRSMSNDSCKKEKSLELLTRQFLFMLIKHEVIGISDLAKSLIDSRGEVSVNFKTKIRRLYDIANVLASLGMLERIKLDNGSGKKLSFKWLGVKNICDISSLEVTEEENDECIIYTQTDSGFVEDPTRTENIESEFKQELKKLIIKYPNQWQQLFDTMYIKSIAAGIYPI